MVNNSKPSKKHEDEDKNSSKKDKAEDSAHSNSPKENNLLGDNMSCLDSMFKNSIANPILPSSCNSNPCDKYSYDPYVSSFEKPTFNNTLENTCLGSSAECNPFMLGRTSFSNDSISPVSSIRLNQLSSMHNDISDSILNTSTINSGSAFLHNNSLGTYQVADIGTVTSIFSDKNMYTFSPTITQEQKLEEEISKLKKEKVGLALEVIEIKKSLDETNRDKNMVESDKKNIENKLKKLDKKQIELESKQKLNYLLPRVNEKARQKLFNSKAFQELFISPNCQAFVISIDIRRSTELMLKAKTPERFENFLISLCSNLSEIIIKNFGVFEKFTGDGVLAFFPSFYSGKDCGLMAIKTALECHEFFKNHYKTHRDHFTSVLMDTGLGIGIDYGDIYMSNFINNLTIVGVPVVYACRMSAANAGDTLLNQPAYEQLTTLYPEYLYFEQTSIIIKNEGEILSHKLGKKINDIKYTEPNWESIPNNKKEEN